MNRVVIVGGSGFLAKRLLESGEINAKIITTSRRKEDHDCLFLDLKKPFEFDFSLVDKNDIFVFLAAVSSPKECSDNYEDSYLVNVTGTSFVIERCLDLGIKVIFASSDTVYGESPDEVFEGDMVTPLGPYAEMKVLVENNFKYSKLFKVVRFSYIFARNDNFTKYVLNCIEKKNICDVFDPFSRSVVWVNDVIKGISSLCNNWELHDMDEINFCGPELLSRISFAEAFRSHLSNFDMEVICPKDSFYKARPRNINMKSKYFKTLIGENPSTIFDAIKKEIK